MIIDSTPSRGAMQVLPYPSSRSIDRCRIDVWLAFYDELVEERLLSAMDSILSSAERAQQQRFHFADDRKRHGVTRAMVRSVLSRYAPVAPADWRFIENDYGRPAVAHDHPGAAGLQFNISHARGLIALAVGHDCELGVDVENLVHRPVSTEIADRFFSPEEAAELASVPLEHRQDRFFEYWTLKESYIKARAMGLSLPLDKFSFMLKQPHEIRMRIDDSLQDDPQRWSFFQYRPTRDHLMALCIERRAGPPPIVTLRKMTPTGDFARFDSLLLKSSAFD